MAIICCNKIIMTEMQLLQTLLTRTKIKDDKSCSRRCLDRVDSIYQGPKAENRSSFEHLSAYKPCSLIDSLLSQLQHSSICSMLLKLHSYQVNNRREYKVHSAHSGESKEHTKESQTILHWQVVLSCDYDIKDLSQKITISSDPFIPGVPSMGLSVSNKQTNKLFFAH